MNTRIAAVDAVSLLSLRYMYRCIPPLRGRLPLAGEARCIAAVDARAVCPRPPASTPSRQDKLFADLDRDLRKHDIAVVRLSRRAPPRPARGPSARPLLPLPHKGKAPVMAAGEKNRTAACPGAPLGPGAACVPQRRVGTAPELRASSSTPARAPPRPFPVRVPSPPPPLFRLFSPESPPQPTGADYNEPPPSFPCADPAPRRRRRRRPPPPPAAAGGGAGPGAWCRRTGSSRSRRSAA